MFKRRHMLQCLWIYVLWECIPITSHVFL